MNHPAVTSAIIGPRTMEQLESQLPAAAVVLDAATLDRIDEIVRPGINLNPADTSYGEQVLQPASAAADPAAGSPQSQATDGSVGGYGSTPSIAHANTYAMPARSHSDSVGTIPLLQCQP